MSKSEQEKQAAYDKWFVAEVEKGLADIDAGNVLTEEEAAAHIGNCLILSPKKPGK